MDYEPLRQAGAAIQIHTILALAAFVLGAVQFALPKGTGPHRAIGYVWVGLMMTVAGSSLFITALNPGNYSPIHLLSVFVLITAPRAVLKARRGDIAGHRRSMGALFFLALLVAGAFTLLPGRILYRVVQPAISAAP